MGLETGIYRAVAEADDILLKSGIQLCELHVEKMPSRFLETETRTFLRWWRRHIVLINEGNIFLILETRTKDDSIMQGTDIHVQKHRPFFLVHLEGVWYPLYTERTTIRARAVGKHYVQST